MGQNQDGTQPPEMQNGEMNGQGGMRGPMGQNQDGTQPPEMQNGETNMQRGQFRGFGGNSTQISSEHHVQINGGNIYIIARNDGIDSNGSIVIAGGTVVLEGREFAGGGESGFDSDMATVIEGGEVISAGTVISEANSKQNTLLVNFSEKVNKGSLVEIKDSSNKAIMSLNAGSNMSQVLYSSDKLKDGSEYIITVDGEEKEKVTFKSNLTTVGSASSNGGRMMFGGNMNFNQN